MSYSCSILLPTRCHFVIVYVHGGEPECHPDIISPHVLGSKDFPGCWLTQYLNTGSTDPTLMVVHILFKQLEQNVLS